MVVLAFTIAAEIGDISRFATPKKVCGYTGRCPRVNQSGDRYRRGPLTKQGPKYLRWAMLEATTQALRHPAYVERYQRNKRRLGRQRGAKVAQIDIARKLAEAFWHPLTNSQPFTPAPGRLHLSSGRLTALETNLSRADTRRANLLAALSRMRASRPLRSSRPLGTTRVVL